MTDKRDRRKYTYSLMNKKQEKREFMRLNHVMKTGGRSLMIAFLHSIYNVKICGNSCSLVQVYPFNDCSWPQKCELYSAIGMPAGRGKMTLESGHEMCDDFNAYHYTVTIIREPLERLLSHYRMLIQIKEKGNVPREIAPSDDPSFLGNGVEYFLTNFPDEYKVHQLSFYSKERNVDEAFENIIKHTQIILTENQQEGLDRLFRKSGMQLKEHKPPKDHSTKNVHFVPNEEQIALMKDTLKDEYKFYNRVIDYYNNEVQS